MRQAILALVAFVCCVSSACAEDALIREQFSGGKMDAAWRVHLSKGNEISVGDGYAEIKADVNTFAHLMRPCGQDNITLSARIAPSEPAGVTWCTSVFLVWQGGNWCQMGMITSPNGSGGAYYVVETLEGVTREIPLTGCDLSKPHRVCIQLATDGIRYLVLDDGDSWKALRTIKRPDMLTGPPSFVAVGKGFGRGVAPYDQPLLLNDYSDRGPKVTSQVSDIRVEETPAGKNALTADERKAFAAADLDPVGKIELRGRDDTTYDKVAEYYPPMKLPKEAVGVPEHPVDIAVDHLGRLQLNYNQPPMAWIEIGDPPVPFGDENSHIKRRLMDGYLPVVILSRSHDGLECEQTVFGWSEGFSPDTDLYAFMRLKVRATDGAKLPVKASLVVGTEKKRIDLPIRPTLPGEGAVCMKFPYPASDTQNVSPITNADFEWLLTRVASSWNAALKPGMRISVPDERVNDAYKAWLAYSLLDVDKINGYCEPHDGTGFYEEIYGYSAGLYCIMLDMYGMHDRAARYLDTLIHFQQPDGLYTQNFGLPDQGMFLLALSEHFNYTGDREWLKRVSPSIVKAGDWLLRMREKAPKSGVLRGLIKFRAYCDYATPVYDYYADTYCCVGLGKAASALKAIGMADEARRFEDEAARYRTDILASMAKSAVRKDGRTILPLEPETHRLLKDNGYTGGEYYGLVASSLLENEFLPADDKRSHWLTDQLEQKNGLLAGLCRFQTGGIDHAYTYGYLLTQLKRGDARKVILGFWSMLAYGMTRDTYSGVECTNAVSGQNYWTLPHLYSSTQQLRLLRNMLLREDGDSLRIGEAIPRAWLAQGRKVEVRAAPTRFGDVSYTIQSDVSRGRIALRFDPPTRSTPSGIRITLRHPEFRPIRRVLVNNKGWSKFGKETIDLPVTTKRTTIRVEYEH